MAVHAAAWMLLRARPDAEIVADRSPAFAEVVLIELPAQPPSGAEVSDPIPDAEPSADVRPRARAQPRAHKEPRAKEESHDKPDRDLEAEPSHWTATQREAGRHPSALGDAPNDDVSAVVPPTSTGALALSGLRGDALSRRPLSMGVQTAAPLSGAPGPVPVTHAQRDAGLARAPPDFGFRRTRGRWVRVEPVDDAWSAELLPDGRVHFRDRKLCSVPGLPCWTKAKRRLLVATSAMRLAMAKNHARRNIERQLQRLNRDLLAIWRSNRPPRTRRRLVFEAWDECEEALTIDLGDFARTDPSEVDALRHRSGTAARAKIIAFIERQIPVGSADAFGPAEVIAMNDGRMSTERFEPYPGGR